MPREASAKLQKNTIELSGPIRESRNLLSRLALNPRKITRVQANPITPLTAKDSEYDLALISFGRQVLSSPTHDVNKMASLIMNNSTNRNTPSLRAAPDKKIRNGKPIIVKLSNRKDLLITCGSSLTSTLLKTRKKMITERIPPLELRLPSSSFVSPKP